MIDMAALEAAGVYDPDAPEAAERRELLDFLQQLGATTEEVIDAHRTYGLIHLVGEINARTGEMFDVNELSARSQYPLPLVLRIYELLGVAVVDRSEKRFSEDDVEFLIALGSGPTTLFDIDELAEMLRVFGTSLTRICDAAVATFARGVEQRLIDSGATELTRAKAEAEGSYQARNIPLLMGTIMRHHMTASVRRLRGASAAAESPEAFRLGVGFVDIVGFTPLSATLDTRQLGDAVSAFENRSSDIVARAGGQVIKHMGDAIMYVAVDPVTACEVALSLTEDFADQRIEPHAGLTYGEVVTRRGDYYGPTVNLSSRLVNHAVPGEVLVNTDLVTAVGEQDAYRYTPAGRRTVRGFEKPVEVHTLSRAG